MTYDEIEARLRILAGKVRWIAATEANGVRADADVYSDELLELADQLNLTAHPVTIVRPKAKRR